MAKDMFIPLFLIALVVASGCAQQKEIKEIMLPGQGNTVYQFTYDIRESLAVKANNETAIRDYLHSVDRINIVYNGSSGEDILYFKVVLINVLGKLQAYFAYKGVPMGVTFYYFIGDQWYESIEDGTSREIGRPSVSGATIWLVGPNTGADDTSLILRKGIIYVQGKTYKDLVLAGDRLALIVFGIESVDDAIKAAG